MEGRLAGGGPVGVGNGDLAKIGRWLETGEVCVSFILFLPLFLTYFFYGGS